MQGPTTSAPTTSAVIVAAGRSERMRAEGAPAVRKPLIELGGRPIVRHTAEALAAAEGVVELVVVGHADDQSVLGAALEGLGLPVTIVPGGASRAESVARGVDACRGDVEVIAVHDAARPFVDPARVTAVCAAALEHGGALLAAPARDTLKVSEDGRTAERTLDRSMVHAAHTPQAFRAADFRGCQARAEADGFRPTDDAGLWERYRGAPRLVEDDDLNFKITRPADLELARALVAARDAAASGRSSTE